MTPRARVLALIGVAIALGLPAIPIDRMYDEFADVAHLIGYEAMWWAAAALLLVYARVVEHAPVSSLGIRRPSVFELVLAVAAGVIIVVILGTLYALVLDGLDSEAMATLIGMMPKWWLVISVVRAGVCEELLFRGYAFERLAAVTRSRRIAGLVTWVVFTIEHVPAWGWAHVLIAGVGGGLLTLLYVWRRNLWVNIIAHIVIDGAAFLA